MPRPPIEVCWGGRLWKRPQRSVVRPTVDAAVSLAETALEEVGLHYTHPKRLTIVRSGRSSSLVGTSDGPTEIELYFRTDHIKHRKIADQLTEIVLGTGHELVHAIRSEYFDDQTLGEHVASEGLAYVGEGILGALMLGESEPRVADFIRQSAKEDYDGLKDDLLKDLYCIPTGEPTDPHDAWLEIGAPKVPRGILVGVVEITRRLEEGNDFADLFRWPMLELLDLGARAEQG